MTQIPPTTAALILAAGRSSRMGEGRYKLLLPLGNRPVLAHVLDATLASQARPIVVVLGHQLEQMQEQLSAYAQHPFITIVTNPDYTQGMSTSLRLGLRTLIESHNHVNMPAYSLDSLIVLPGDQPLITPPIINQLIATRHVTGKPIIASFYAGKRRNPVLFSADLFGELLEVTGDEGGKTVLERHRQDIVAVEHDDIPASYDVDTWAAYQAVVDEWQRRQQQAEKRESSHE